jgi:UDP-N-acetylglucosamine 4,6-dehydratase (inverting)
MLNNKNILVTGGTGSFGQKFVEIVLKKYPKINKLVVFSRDEQKQHQMSQIFNEKKYPCLRYFLGDIREYERLNLAFQDIDIVVHAAALKHVGAAEYNPFEFVKTNIVGSQNVVNAAINNKVKNVIALSTDKAVAPANLYGATKLCSDKIFLSANNIKGNRKIKFSAVRYGNVFGSRGSVVPIFIEQRKKGELTVTDRRMTRFNITIEESVNMVLWSLANNLGGEIYIPKLPSYNVLDLAKAVSPKSKIKFTGIKIGEKLHEVLVLKNESDFILDIGKYFIQVQSNKIFEKLRKKFKKSKLVKEDFKYDSGTNSNFLSLKDLQYLIKNIE